MYTTYTINEKERFGEGKEVMKERGNFRGKGGLRTSTFKGASQCEAGEPQKPQEEYFGVCLVAQATDRAWLWLSTLSTRMGGAGGQRIRTGAKNNRTGAGKAARWVRCSEAISLFTTTKSVWSSASGQGEAWRLKKARFRVYNQQGKSK